MVAGRAFSGWYLIPPYDPNAGYDEFDESASSALLIEMLGEQSDIARIGRQRFPGSLAQKNTLWREDRNYLKQALSNFSAALQVPNRSACLLYYYALLNFAKSELLPHHHASIVDKRLGHGLSFNPTRAKSVRGDFLTVQDGVFRMVYEHRTGQALPVGTRLPIARILQAIPEIGQQRYDAGIGAPLGSAGIIQLIALDRDSSWIVLAIDDNEELGSKSATGVLFRKHFREIDRPSNWRDNFGLTRRWVSPLRFYESKQVVGRRTRTSYNQPKTIALCWALHPYISMRTDESYDAMLAPSLYKSKLVPFPPSLARYAAMYYASSLVRYKPSMFDPVAYPEQAYLFDALARELALPMLIDITSAIRGRGLLFYSSGSKRV